jgi:ubiquinone/menaquinone biosynthesis C-methylase UbiE
MAFLTHNLFLNMKKNTKKPNPSSSSWEPASKWYKSIVGEEGHYYHQQIILPGVMRLLNLPAASSPLILDLACGSGVLGRHLPDHMEYTGLDLSPTLIKEATKLDVNPKHRYFVADVMKNLPLEKQTFTHSTIILALQNIQNPLQVLINLSKHLQKGGILMIVLNHPCFRIPRQSFWQIDENKKLQYRRIDRYMSDLEIPIQAHPSKGKQSAELVSYHHPISSYFHWLKEAGFKVNDMEEWCSDKISTGAHAKMENRSRSEFPLFLAIMAEKT